MPHCGTLSRLARVLIKDLYLAKQPLYHLLFLQQPPIICHHVTRIIKLFHLSRFFSFIIMFELFSSLMVFSLHWLSQYLFSFHNISLPLLIYLTSYTFYLLEYVRRQNKTLKLDHITNEEISGRKV